MANARGPIVDICDLSTNNMPMAAERDMSVRSRPMKTPMSEQTQLESYPRRNIQSVQHGTNLVFNTTGARKQQNQTSCSAQDARE